MDTDATVISYINTHILPTVSQTRKYVIGVDVGGTNTRVAIGGLDGNHVIVAKFLASTLTQLLDGLEQLAAPIITHMGFPPYAACLDIAGPVQEQGNMVEITNYLGTSEERILMTSALPITLFPAGRTIIINDLESCCYGILGLNEQKKLGDYFTPLWSAGNNTVELANVHQAVLAAGTGLGCGILLKFPNRPFSVYSLEYGHALIPSLGAKHPGRELDQKLLDYLSERLYGGNYGAEYEDICSGRGVTYVYDFLVQGLPDTPSGLSAAEIVLAADSGNANALKALEIHYRFLLRTAQNICVGANVKGVFLAGDNQVSNHKFVASFVQSLKDEFLNHPKRHWIENVPVYAQTTSININVYGTLYVARLLVTSSPYLKE